MLRERLLLFTGALLWCAGIVAAPLTGERTVYRFYTPVCHQFESRSLRIAERPLAVCGRCSGIYAGFLAAAGVMLAVPSLALRRSPGPGLLIPSLLPLAASLLAEWGGMAEVTTAVRTVTGLFAGAGLAAVLYRTLTDAIGSLFSNHTSTHETNA